MIAPEEGRVMRVFTGWTAADASTIEANLRKIALRTVAEGWLQSP